MNLKKVATLKDLLESGLIAPGQVVTARVDLNVLTKEGELKTAEPPRIKSLTGLLNFAKRAQIKLVLFSHAEVDKVFPSLENAALAIPRVTGVDITAKYVDAIVGENVGKAFAELNPGEVLVLGNTRQDPRETAGDLALAEEVFAILGKPKIHILNNLDIAHRPKHALVGAYPVLVTSNGGFYLASDHLLSQVTEIDEVVKDKEIVFVLAGAKDKDKVAALLADSGRQVKKIIPGGGFLNSLLAAQGCPINPKNKGVDEKQVKNASKAIRKLGEIIAMPIDVVVADNLSWGSEKEEIYDYEITENHLIGDIGPETEIDYETLIRECAEEGTPIVASCAMGKENFSLIGTWTIIKNLREASELTDVLIIGDDSNKLVDRAIEEGVITDRGSMRKSTAGGAAAEYIALNGDLPTLDFTKKEEIR